MNNNISYLPSTIINIEFKQRKKRPEYLNLEFANAFGWLDFFENLPTTVSLVSVKWLATKIKLYEYLNILLYYMTLIFLARHVYKLVLNLNYWTNSLFISDMKYTHPFISDWPGDRRAATGKTSNFTKVWV